MGARHEAKYPYYVTLSEGHMLTVGSIMESKRTEWQQTLLELPKDFNTYMPGASFCSRPRAGHSVH